MAKVNAKQKTEQKVATANKGLPIVWIVPLLIVAFTYVIFSPSLQNDFTNWDDLDYVLENTMVMSDHIPWEQIFTTPVSLNYHPLTILSLAWNYQAGELDPYGYHLVNVLFHLLNTLLVFVFVFVLTRKNIRIAAIVSLFFGIHPMHVESVTWISERKDVLYVFFFMAGLIAYLQYRQSQKILWYIFCLLLFILSCLSKGMAVVFPLVLLLIDYYSEVKISVKIVIEKIPFFLVALLFGLLAFYIQNKGGVTVAMENFSTFQRILFASYGLVIYIVKLFVPYKLAAFHPYPLINREDILPDIFYVYPFIVLAAATAVYFLYRKKKPVIFGLLFYLVTVAMVIQFVSVGFAIIADRYSYLCYIGLLFVLASLFDSVFQKNNSWKYPLVAVLTIWAVMFGFQTYARTQVWKNSETLFTDEMEKYPEVDRSYWHRGIFYQNLNRNDEALKDFNKALEINPFYGAAYNSRAKLLFSVGQYDLSLADCYKAIEFDSLDKGTLINCGIIFRSMGKYDDALKYFNKAYKIDSNNPGLFINRGIYYDLLNENEKALADFSKYLSLYKKKDATAHNYRGVSYSKLERHVEAISDFSEAIAIEPSTPLFYLNRSISEYKIGKVENARNDAFKAQELGTPVDTNYIKLLLAK